MYGSLGPQGFTRLGPMAQAMSPPPQGLAGLPPTTTPTPTPPADIEAPAAPTGLAEAMWKPWPNSERDSQSKGLYEGMTGAGGRSDFIASEPGAMSFLGLSSGTAFDRQGQGYDTTNLDVGALAGGLLGGLAGPVGGLAGGLAGRQLDLNAVLGAERNPGLFIAGQRSGMSLSRGEQRAQREARDWWSGQNPAATAFQQAQPAAPRGSPQLERLLSQAQQQRQSTTERGHNVGSSSAGGKGTQSVSGATRNSGFGGKSFGDRGRR